MYIRSLELALRQPERNDPELYGLESGNVSGITTLPTLCCTSASAASPERFVSPGRKPWVKGAF